MRIATVSVGLVVLVACGGGGDGSPDATVSDSATDAPASDAAIDGPASQCPTPRAIAVTSGEVTIINDPGAAKGIFDPSVVYPAGAPGGALAYSAVPDQHSIRTRIALSGDAGASWTYVGEANVPEAATIATTDTVDCPSGACSGSLISEVPSIIFDPTDPNAATRWKLFAHRYLVEPNDKLHYRLGTITLQTAANPQGPWSAPEKLFGLTSPSTFTTQGARYNATTFTGFADCLVLTEPGAIVLPNLVDVAMGCVYLDGATPRIKVVLARSTDHGVTWAGVGQLVAPGAADCLDPTVTNQSVNAPNLFVGPDGQEYLAVTGNNANGYDGCVIFHVDNPLTGHVDPVPVRAIVTDTGQFSGACTWSEGGGGYLIDIGFLSTARPFRTFRAGAAF